MSEEKKNEIKIFQDNRNKSQTHEFTPKSPRVVEKRCTIHFKQTFNSEKLKKNQNFLLKKERKKKQKKSHAFGDREIYIRTKSARNESK